MEIRMPAVSPTMEKGNLARWFVAVGTTVKRGDAVAEIETDKASVELESEEEGVLAEILVNDGTADVAVGTVLAKLAPLGSEVKAESNGAGGAATTQAPKAEPKPAEATTKPAAPAQAESVDTFADDGVIASPLSRRLARQLGIDLRDVRGTGPRGRVLKSDLEAIDARLRQQAAAPAAPAASADVVHPPPRDIPLRSEPLATMRKTIARRLGESKRSVPHFYMSTDATVDALVKLRRECNDRPDAVKLSLNDFVIRACAMALTKVPEANVQYGGDVLHRFERVDLSVAVAVDDGLYTPVIKDAASKGVQSIAQEMAELAEKARTGKLHPSEYEGGTFSISNLGMYGVREFAAVINPPQAGILAVGSVQRRVVPVDDESDDVRVQRQMTLTLSCDHRVVDGAVGARLLAEIRARLEDPLSLLLG